eukprot:CAMPEP_0170558308 /NCGR_PEP_ID=MMETSP0211-20121228/34348_1 /TAXON_ID=311385 /ORGANISM="Pseudokeronopsis sp., Strain OXSARD2" /LENGTH=60 /DNA_ID=CAMNT_0010870127 /DNA_START=1 /DNA_END=183 /DNA_ORIENTATION=+
MSESLQEDYGDEEMESEEEDFAYKKAGKKDKKNKKENKVSKLSAFADYEEFAHLLEEGVP